VDDSADDAPACVAISNALNEVVNGLALSPTDWGHLGTDRTRVAAVLARYAALRGLHEELRFHLEMRVAEYEARGPRVPRQSEQHGNGSAISRASSMRS
jgi:hypothetical protein